jgi:hypothetical protein
MPPRKPKQPAKRKVPTRKAAPKKAQPKAATTKAATTKATTPSGEEYNPQTHILCDDGKVYERKIVSGTGTAVGVNSTVKTDAHLDLERKMVATIHQAHSEGVTDAEEMRRRILAAREEHLGGKD